MTLAQYRTLLPLLVAIGEALRPYLAADDPDARKISPPVYLTFYEWQRILEEFGTL